MAENTSSRRAIIISVVAAIALVAVLVGVVVWALNRPSVSAVDPAATRSAFASAMRKASVDATYPPDAPVPLTSVIPTGKHAFSATFSAEELTALLSAFSYTARVNGTSATLQRATVKLVDPNTLGLTATVNSDGNTFSATMEGPITYELGRAASTGATSANVEGITLDSDQLTQLTDAVLGYLNAYLDDAPGLRIGSARVASDGLAVTGVAPDSITYP